jgi:hypothetical protein
MKKPATRHYLKRPATLGDLPVFNVADVLRTEKERRLYLDVVREDPESTADEVRDAIADIDRSRLGKNSPARSRPGER